MDCVSGPTGNDSIITHLYHVFTLLLNGFCDLLFSFFDLWTVLQAMLFLKILDI